MQECGRVSSLILVCFSFADSGDANFVKLFVGSVPRTITEEEVSY